MKDQKKIQDHDEKLNPEHESFMLYMDDFEFQSILIKNTLLAYEKEKENSKI